MSLFRDETPIHGALVLDPTKLISGTSSGAPASGMPPGTIWYDSSGNFQAITASSTAPVGLQLSLAPIQIAGKVTNTNPTAATALMTYIFPAGSLNNLGRTVELFGAGEITTGVGTTTTVAVTLGDGTNTRTVATFTTGALTTAQTNLPWQLNLDVLVAASGATGTVFGHGYFGIPLTAPTAGATTYYDQNTAVSSALDLTQKITLTVNSLFGTGNAGNAVTQDMLVIVVSN